MNSYFDRLLKDYLSLYYDRSELVILLDKLDVCLYDHVRDVNSYMLIVIAAVGLARRHGLTDSLTRAAINLRPKLAAAKEFEKEFVSHLADRGRAVDGTHSFRLCGHEIVIGPVSHSFAAESSCSIVGRHIRLESTAGY